MTKAIQIIFTATTLLSIFMSVGIANAQPDTWPDGRIPYDPAYNDYNGLNGVDQNLSLIHI